MLLQKTGKLVQLIATRGYIHKIGSDDYPTITKRFVLPSESVDDFEELLEVPKYNQEEYGERVDNLIREKYSISQELAILRQKDTKVEEYEEYNRFAEECKLKAQETIKRN